jgi:hypothetical protein
MLQVERTLQVGAFLVALLNECDAEAASPIALLATLPSAAVYIWTGATTTK